MPSNRRDHPALPQSWQVEASYANTLGAVAAARQFVAAELSALFHERPDAGAAVVDDARLITSELVTNAVRSGAGTVWVRVHSHGESVRIEVADDGAGLPTETIAESDARTGRGLRIVAGIADTWGYDATPTGKQVWAELNTERA